MTEAWPDMAERQAAAQVVEWQPRARLVWAERRGFLFQSLRYIQIEELAPGNCIVAIGIRFRAFAANCSTTSIARRSRRRSKAPPMG